MGTCTFRPDVQSAFEMKAKDACGEARRDWNAIEAFERFGFLQQEALQEVQRYWKRLRKRGLTFKYLAVFEEDQSGRPHTHCLIHETDPARQIRKRELDESWGLGFTNFRLLKLASESKPPHGAITYVTKAIATHRQGRICASFDYSPERHLPKGDRPEQLDLPLG